MKDIIVVGLSKAGSLHINAYNKMKNIGNIYYVDISGIIKNKNIKKQKVYTSIEDACITNNLESNNVIVDICVPKEEFWNIINQCIRQNIKNVIVEKPFIASKEFFNVNHELNIIMMQNYLYSEITKDIIKFIKKENCSIKAICTDFSKNRIKDSMNNRGFLKKVTQNFEIEIPHQIYLADYIINSNKKINILYKEQKDFEVNGLVLKKHGYGKIIMNQDNVLIIHESDLMTDNKRKEINIICDNDLSINAKYLLYDNDMNIRQKGKLVIKNNDSIIIEKEYSIDDNMYNCLNEYYRYFNDNLKNYKYINRILRFSKVFKEIIE